MISSVQKIYEVVVEYADPSLLQRTVVDYLQAQWVDHPHHVVIVVAFFCVFMYFYMVPLHKAKAPPEPMLTEKERQQLINAHCSTPFNTGDSQNNWSDRAIVRRRGPYCEVGTTFRGDAVNPMTVECADFITFDFHSLGVHPDVLEVAKETIKTYGVGSCGPRGFYGTIQPHINAEKDISKFLRTKATIIFSYGFATVSTVVPAFSARGDYILIDEMCSLAIQEGAMLSRSNLQYYRHNDMLQLEEMMACIDEKEKRSKKAPTRKYVLTEGLFSGNGDLCHLKHIVVLCKKYRFRLILEDSFGFGVLGATGRGTPEHFGIPMSDISLYIGSLGTSLGSIGGFCSGEANVIDHQRLGATGYVFSASLPCYATAGVSATVKMLEVHGKELVSNLKRNSIAFRREIRRFKLPISIGMVDCEDDVSPLVHFKPITPELIANHDNSCNRKFDLVVADMFEKHFYICRSSYNDEERTRPTPSLRVAIKSGLSEDDVKTFAKVLVASLRNRFN